MNYRVVIDSSVFVSVLGLSDIYTFSSHKFFATLNEQTEIIIPTLVVAETITTLGKQKKESAQKAFNHLSSFRQITLDKSFLVYLLEMVGISTLKTSDFIIALTAKIHKATLITWDKQQLSSKNTLCQAITPDEFLRKIGKN